MKLSAGVALLLSLAVATPVFAADEVIRVEPAHPTSTDPIRVTVSGANQYGCEPQFLGLDRGELVLGDPDTTQRTKADAGRPIHPESLVEKDKHFDEV